MVAPPFDAGAVNATMALLSPAVTVPMVGAPGAVSVAETPPAELELPTPLLPPQATRPETRLKSKKPAQGRTAKFMQHAPVGHPIGVTDSKKEMWRKYGRRPCTARDGYGFAPFGPAGGTPGGLQASGLSPGAQQVPLTAPDGLEKLHVSPTSAALHASKASRGGCGGRLCDPFACAQAQPLSSKMAPTISQVVMQAVLEVFMRSLLSTVGPSRANRLPGTKERGKASTRKHEIVIKTLRIDRPPTAGRAESAVAMRRKNESSFTLHTYFGRRVSSSETSSKRRSQLLHSSLMQ